MKKLFLFLSLLSAINFASAQMTIGKNSNTLNAEKPRRIGTKMSLLTPQYELWSVDKDGQHSEYLRYLVQSTSNVWFDLKFSSMQEEKDFYTYVLGLFDNFQDNEIKLKNYKVIPHKFKIFGKDEIQFDVFLFTDTDRRSNQSIAFTKKDWIKLFQSSAAVLNP